MSDLLFIDEVAELVRVPISSVRYWIRKGRLPSLKPGRRVMVRRAALQAFLSNSERDPAGSVQPNGRVE